MTDTITLSHGSGGEESQELLSRLIFSAFDNPLLRRAEDSTPLPALQHPFFCTDSFTVTPLFFNGGDIGKLSICGTCNDLAVMGAQPRYLSCSLLIEEGFSTALLRDILSSMAKEAANAKVSIVTGDTKVLPKGTLDQIIINTSGIGEGAGRPLSAHQLQTGDAIIVSGTIGDHGVEIFARREGINLTGELRSDCQLLWPAITKLLESGLDIHAMRDATRGGLAAILNEWTESSSAEITIRENQLPIRDAVRGACEMLGFEPTHLANEGMFALALPETQAAKAIELLRSLPGHTEATLIGQVNRNGQHRVVLESEWGTQRLMERPSGELLPRIC